MRGSSEPVCPRQNGPLRRTRLCRWRKERIMRTRPPLISRGARLRRLSVWDKRGDATSLPSILPRVRGERVATCIVVGFSHCTRVDGGEEGGTDSYTWERPFSGVQPQICKGSGGMSEEKTGPSGFPFALWVLVKAILILLSTQSSGSPSRLQRCPTLGLRGDRHAAGAVAEGGDLSKYC